MAISPKECFVMKKQTKEKKQTFSVCSNLSWQEDKPLSMGNLSRYVFTGIDIFNSGEKVINIANIPAREVPVIVDTYRETMIISKLSRISSAKKDTAAKDGISEKEQKVIDALNLAPKMGKYKGIPYWKLLKDNRDAVSSQYEFLKKNLEKYPQNKSECGALNYLLKMPQEILDGFIKKCDTGDDSVVNNSVFTIYDSGMKPKMTSEKEGKHLIYEVKIQYDSSRNYPFIIMITNGYAPVVQKDGGMLNVIFNEMVEKKTVTVNLSESDGRTLFTGLESDLQAFKTCSYKNQLNIANEIDKKNREAAGH